MPLPVGYKHSEETKRKIGLAHKGSHRSMMARKKMSEARKGKIPWNKGKKYPTPFQEGSKNHNYKGGKFKDKEGYVLIKKRNHPFCNAKGYIREHRIVIEQQIGRYLLPQEKCHHLGKKDDNRPHMLMAFSNQSTHLKFEANKEVKPCKIIFDGRFSR